MKHIFLKLVLSIIAITLCLCISVSAAEKPSVASNEIINTIKLLEIANGDENGNMNYDKNVTRAEFIKMAVTASPNKEKAQNSSFSYSLFPDVKNTFWGAGYISVAIESGLVNGYLDGTFRPNNMVTLEEATTIALRLLGYTSADFSGTYPSSQIEKYLLLNLDENISAKVGDKLTREECMILLYNTLCANTKTGTKYCTTLGYSANSHGKIDYSALLEKKLDGPVIFRNDGKTTYETNFAANASTVYYLNNAYAAKTDIKSGDVIYYSSGINSVFIYRKTATGIVNSVNGGTSVALYGGKTYEIKTTEAKSKLSLGGEFSEKNCFVTLILGLNDTVIDVIAGDMGRIGDNSDNIPYISMIDATISPPIYLETDADISNYKSLIPFDLDNAIYYINGTKTDTYNPQKLDVIYYSKQFNSIWVYRKTESGNITNITSASVTIGTKSYALATDIAKSKLSTYGEYKVDSYVTVVLGKNDEVVDLFGYKAVSDGNESIIDDSISLPIYIKDDASLKSWAQTIPFAVAEAKFYLNGVETYNPEIRVLDVLYYSTSYKSIWIFRETASGVIISTTSSTVSVGSKTYTLATTDAKNKVSNYGIYGEDDYVTLILGKGKEVIDVLGNGITYDTDEPMIDESISLPIYIRDDKSLQNWTQSIPFSVDDARFYLNGKAVTNPKIEVLDVLYYSTSYNSIWIFRDRVSGVISLASTSSVTIGGKSYILATNESKNKVSNYGIYGEDDYVTLILGKGKEVIDVLGNGITYDTDEPMIDESISLPIYIRDDKALKNWTQSIPFSVDDARFYLNGKEVTNPKIEVLDVLYYSTSYNSIWIFRDRVSGVISLASTSSVTIGTKTYILATNEAKNKVSNYGIYGEDDYVTLIFGKGKEVIDILINSSSFDSDEPVIDESISLPIYIRDDKALQNWVQYIPFSVDDARFFLNGKEVTNPKIEILDVLYYSASYNSIWIFRDTVSGVVSLTSTTNIAIGSKSYALGTNEAKNKISSYGIYGVDDYVTLVLGKGKEVIDIFEADISDIGKNEDDSTYTEIVTSSLKGPYVVTAEGNTDKLTIDITSAKFLYLNKEINYSEIRPYDVYYFSPVLKTVWIYRDSISGTIESITTPAAPTSVTLSGKAYGIESAQAAYDLSSFGAFGVGDKATFLLGMDGKVAGVVSIDTVSHIYYGVVTARGSKEFTEKDGTVYTSDFITVTDINGNSHTYEHNKRSLGVGDIVRVSVGETVKLTEQNTTIGRSGIALIVNAINNKKLSDDCKIIEIYGTTVKKVYPSRFDGAALTVDTFLYSSTILYYNFDENGNLNELILNNFTGDILEYGLVTSSGNSQVTYMTSNTKKTASISGLGCKEGPVVIYSDNGAVSSFKNLSGSVSDVDFITKKAVYDTKDKEYLLADNVKIFHSYAGSYKLLTIEEAIAGDYEYVAYYDKLPENAGRIRVIIATNAS